MAHNRPQEHPHLGNIPPIQTRSAMYTYQIMQHPGIPAQHIPGGYTQSGNRMPLQQQMYYYSQKPQMSEEQMKMQLREHNYHIQQQRLRSFNASSSNQKRVNPDDLIQSMFGKTQNVKQSTPAVQKTTTKPEVMEIPIPQQETVVLPQELEIEPQQLPVNNTKNFEDMLLKCSDLMQPGKAHSFPKVVGREVNKSSKRKNSNEIKIDDTGEMKTNNLGFPSWCFIEAQIPDLYRRVQQIATVDNSIDTNLLYPILLSSGLNRDVLGHIWALVNQTTPGKLLPHELYSALTLVALAQNGYKFTGLDVLQSLARPLLPFLKNFMAPHTAQTNIHECTKQIANDTDTLDDYQEEFTEFLGFAPTVQPPLIGSSAVGNRLANYNVGMSPPAKEKKDQRAEEITKPEMKESDNSDVGHESNMILDKDKYSIFRELDQTRYQTESVDKTDDEFGDFLSVTKTKSPELSIPAHPTLPPTQVLPLSITLNQSKNSKGFKFNLSGEKSVDSLIQTSLTQFQMTKNVPEDDFEFGDFVSPNEMPDPNLGIKDSGSAESQSVSSLDLGPVDAVVAGNNTPSVHSLELKSTFHDDEFGDLQCGMEGLSVSKYKDTINNLSNRILDDRYRFVHNNMQSDFERNNQEWERCLESCYQLLNGADCILNEITVESVCDEVINSDEGINYLKNIVEIYLISARLQHSIRISGLTTESLSKLITNVNSSWTNISSFIYKSNLMPSQDYFHFTNDIPKSDKPSNIQLCGVCLLNVDINSLEFSGRQYHTTCANFWVNCVNSILPALTPQQQLLY